MFYNNQFSGQIKVWSWSKVSCPSNIDIRWSWMYYDTKEKKQKYVGDTLAVSCVSKESCCLWDCTDFPNDSPPYCVMSWDMNIITEKGKNIKYTQYPIIKNGDQR